VSGETFSELSVHGIDQSASGKDRRQGAAKRGSGRPVGALIAWLRAGATCKDQLNHVCETTATFDQRKSARDWFCSTSEAAKAFCERHESEHDSRLDGPDPEPRVMT